MSKELNHFEQSVLPIFRSVTKNNISEAQITNWMLSEGKRLGFTYGQVNWLKIAIAADSKTMLDTVFHIQHTNETQIKEAVLYGISYDDSYECYQTLDYFKEKVKDFFYQKNLINNKIKDLRSKLLQHHLPKNNLHSSSN